MWSKALLPAVIASFALAGAAHAAATIGVNASNDADGNLANGFEFNYFIVADNDNGGEVEDVADLISTDATTGGVAYFTTG